MQFTSAAILGELETLSVRISMDGNGRFLDNIFIERLWRSLKYEEVFIKAYGSVPEARIGIGEWLRFTTTSGRTRRWTTGRRLRCSMVQPVIMWITLPLRSRVTNMITGTTTTKRH